jgi:cell division protein FtsW (lipid II flippase)
MGMLFISGANFFYFLGILAATVGGFFAAIKIGLIKQYQLDRILVFLKPDIQKEGIGYNLFQSKLAIGSGGLWGKGLFLGKQTNLSYVPEHHTDYFFSNWQNISLAVLNILVFIIRRCFYIARAQNTLSYCIRNWFIILTQVVTNIK